ncbi:hypothetical protein SAMN06269185_3027 [Natronoarchaeum philippinense]|uniref:Uncharacterized protein n=1 Tax=Natronoarchaeum philippinense TaxID=558529 RepID=A0A285P6U4_NATPI|nr:HTH domain-containing protein [Natronoarchaeum philippinense]SNZ17450.1 hypothetical protein SAMN06269185_3027 [Natronoarchaeum philippinense]
MGQDTEPFELDVYMRAFVPDAAQRRQEAMLERMRRLRDRGIIDDVSVSRWSSRACLSVELHHDRPDGTELYRELVDATDGTALSIQPFFRERKGPSRGRSVVHLPVVCVVVRRDDAIAGVYPCSAPEGTYSVTDCLDALEDGGDVENVDGDVALDPQPA